MIKLYGAGFVLILLNILSVILYNATNTSVALFISIVALWFLFVKDNSNIFKYIFLLLSTILLIVKIIMLPSPQFELLNNLSFYYYYLTILFVGVFLSVLAITFYHTIILGVLVITYAFVPGIIKNDLIILCFLFLNFVFAYVDKKTFKDKYFNSIAALLIAFLSENFFISISIFCLLNVLYIFINNKIWVAINNQKIILKINSLIKNIFETIFRKMLTIHLFNLLSLFFNFILLNVKKLRAIFIVFAKKIYPKIYNFDLRKIGFIFYIIFILMLIKVLINKRMF